MHEGSRRAFPAPALVLAVPALGRTVDGCHYRNPHDLQRGGIENAAQSRAPDVSRVRRPTPGIIPIQQTAGDDAPQSRLSLYYDRYWIVTNANGYHFINQAGHRLPDG
ncbi:hypothetical protein G6F22_021582 [Rhizopus arrhizus]|nr:hypothetical protein G6F22_021582 [Rhizopus arrhizus]